jgi:hypothetical protein
MDGVAAAAATARPAPNTKLINFISNFLLQALPLRRQRQFDATVPESLMT